MEIFNFFLYSSAVKLKIDVEAMEHSAQDRTTVLTVESGGSRNVEQHGASVAPVSSGQNQSSSVNAEALQAHGVLLLQQKKSCVLLLPASCSLHHQRVGMNIVNF